jgi:ketosteroid isomerase-like protein
LTAQTNPASWCGGKAMNPEKQKQCATELLYAAECNDRKKAESLITDDFHFQLMERLESWTGEDGKSTSRVDKAHFLDEGIKMVGDLTRDGMHFVVHLAITDGPYVALFGESNGTSRQGKAYNNRYCWRFTFSGEKVSEFIEFCDTRYGREVLFEQDLSA